MSEMAETHQSAMGPYVAMAEALSALKSVTAVFREVLVVKVVPVQGGRGEGGGGEGSGGGAAGSSAAGGGGEGGGGEGGGGEGGGNGGVHSV